MIILKIRPQGGRGFVVGVPSLSVALLTNEMHFTVPTDDGDSTDGDA